MKKPFRILLLVYVLLHAGCSSFLNKHEPMVSVIDTIEGQTHVVSAKVGEEGKFNNSVTKDGSTQTISGQVTRSDDKYIVTVEYSSTHEQVPDLRTVNTTIGLKDGESQAIAGLGAEAVYLEISME